MTAGSDLDEDDPRWGVTDRTPSRLDPWRWPRRERGSFPASFVISYGWRQTAFYTPVVKGRCLITTVRLGRRAARGFYGIAGYRNEDDEPEVRIGLGVVEVESYGLGFEPPKDDGDE